MDFLCFFFFFFFYGGARMDVLKLEMERKRKERETLAAGQAPASEAEGGAAKKKKWVRRGDVEAAREAAYHVSEAREAEERAKRLVVPCLRKFDGEGAASTAIDADKHIAGDDALDAGVDAGRSRDGKAAAGAAGTSTTVHIPDGIKSTEVKRLLRKLGQPIQLYGEDDETRLERYRAVAAALPAENEEDDELKRGQMFNETQLFDERGKAKQLGDHSENVGGAGAGADGAGGSGGGGPGGDDDYGGEELEAAFVPTTPEQIVSRHFKQLVKLWDDQLSARDEATARSIPGKREAATFQQCKRHMKPLFRQVINCEKRNTHTHTHKTNTTNDHTKEHASPL